MYSEKIVSSRNFFPRRNNLWSFVLSSQVRKVFGDCLRNDFRFRKFLGDLKGSSVRCRFRKKTDSLLEYRKSDLETLSDQTNISITSDANFHPTETVGTDQIVQKDSLFPQEISRNGYQWKQYSERAHEENFPATPNCFLSERTGIWLQDTEQICSFSIPEYCFYEIFGIPQNRAILVGTLRSGKPYRSENKCTLASL